MDHLPHWATILTGTDMGPVGITWEKTDGEPGDPAEMWTDVYEFSRVVPDGEKLMLGTVDAVEEFLLTDQPGSYRVRVHVVGRDAGNAQGATSDQVVEEHHLALWAAPPAPDSCLRATDGFGLLMGRNAP